MEYDYASVPTIRDFSRDSSRIRCLMGPFGSGKSTGCVIEILRRAMEQEPCKGVRKTRWAVIRNHYRQLQDTTIRTVCDWFPPYQYGQYKLSDQIYTIKKFPGVEIEILFRALDRPDQVGNLLSLELTGAWINEAREVPWAIIEALDGRIGRYPARKDGGCTWAGVLMDTNPPDDDSRLYEYFEVDRPDNAKLFKQPSGLSPEAENLPNLPKDYYTELAKGKTKDYVRIYIEGKYGTISDGQAIYAGEWNDDKHVADEPLIYSKGQPLLLGWDFGLTPACVVAQVGPKGQLRVLREYVSESIGIRRFAEEVVLPALRAEFPGATMQSWGDPSGAARDYSENTAMGILAELGIPTESASSNDLEPRFDAIKYFLLRMISGEPAFLLDKSCSMLRKGFNGGYRLKRLAVPGGDRFQSTPDKNRYSHPAEALQYLCLGVRQSIREEKRPARPVRQVSAAGWS